MDTYCDAKTMRLEARAGFIKRFLDVLGDPSQWEYTGTLIELEKPEGKCVCGHPIKNEYVIENKEDFRTAYVGSECVNHFQEFCPAIYDALVADIESRKTKAKEEARAMKEMLMDEKIAAVRDEYLAKRAAAFKWYDEMYYRDRCYAPYQIYEAFNSRDGFTSKPRKNYKSKACLLKWYKEKHYSLVIFMDKYITRVA